MAGVRKTTARRTRVVVRLKCRCHKTRGCRDRRTRTGCSLGLVPGTQIDIWDTGNVPPRHARYQQETSRGGSRLHRNRMWAQGSVVSGLACYRLACHPGEHCLSLGDSPPEAMLRASRTSYTQPLCPAWSKELSVKLEIWATQPSE
jgi:hypothetical protein